MDPTIDKNGHLDLKVPVGCSCEPLDHQSGHSVHKNGASRSPKMRVWGIKSDPFQQATSQKLPADRGPVAGAKPLHIRLHPSRCRA